VTQPAAPRTPNQDDPRQAPLVVAVLGAIVVAFLLFLPVHANPYKDRSVSEERESVACGNGWHASDDWRDLGRVFRQEATTACSQKRGDRLAQIGVAVTATVLLATFVLALPRRRRSAVEAAPEPETG
jgi:hypothetical protein